MLKIFSSIMFDQLLVFLQGEWSDGAAGGTIMTWIYMNSNVLNYCVQTCFDMCCSVVHGLTCFHMYVTVCANAGFLHRWTIRETPQSTRLKARSQRRIGLGDDATMHRHELNPNTLKTSNTLNLSKQVSPWTYLESNILACHLTTSWQSSYMVAGGTVSGAEEWSWHVSPIDERKVSSTGFAV